MQLRGDRQGAESSSFGHDLRRNPGSDGIPASQFVRLVTRA
jgi:hypothetical protein